ncbi:hypothetical protein [Streptococcus pneumoniae]|nr:hypothetical protein [Streptococcus pneumoniae]
MDSFSGQVFLFCGGRKDRFYYRTI